MLQLHRLHSFVAVVEAGSFTAAAATLGLSKAVVSLHVKQLEAELGSTLLVRTTRSVVATDAGERFHRASLSLLREAESAVAAVRGAHEGFTGTLRITSLAEYLAVVLAPAVAAFSARHPRLRIEASGSSGASDLVRERFDLAIRLGSLRDSSLRATRLGRFRLLAVASPELLGSRGLPRDPSEFTRLPWALFELPASQPGPGPRFTWTDRAGLEHAPVLPVGPALRQRDGRTRHRAHARSSRCSPRLAHARGHCRRAPDRAGSRVPPARAGIFAVRPRAGHVPAKVRRFVEFLGTFVNAEATIAASDRDRISKSAHRI